LSPSDTDSELIESLFVTMETSAADFNHTFRSLTELAKDVENNLELTLNRIMEHVGTVPVLAKRYKPRIHPSQMTVLSMMVKENPNQ
jgi:uncharacterized protein YdiU (UPF0061 family)